MAKYGNHLNTIIKQAIALYSDGKNNLSDLPEIIRPYQYSCGTYDPIIHNHSGPHTKVGFIGNQDMAYYFDFPKIGTDDKYDTHVKQVETSVNNQDTRSPMIFRSYLENSKNFKIYKISNVGNQSMSFSFADYDIDVCFILANSYANGSDVRKDIFYMYYYPTQTVYVFVDAEYTKPINSLYLKFIPRSKIKYPDTLKFKNTLKLSHDNTDADYVYRVTDGEIKDISCYQIYFKDNNRYHRIPNEYIESITYSNNRTLNSQQISYFTQKTRDPNFIELKDQQITIKFYNIDGLESNDSLYLYVSDVETNKNDQVSNINIKRHNGAKVLFKKIKRGTDENPIEIPKSTKIDLIYNILANEKLVYQDHLYFDIKSAELYFEDLGINENQYRWFPYIADKNTTQQIPNKNTIYLRIEYFLNDNENGYISSDTGIDFNNFFDAGNDGSAQNNTENIPFFNYSDTFKGLPDTLECTDVVFVKNSTDTDSDKIKDDTAAFKETISDDFVIDENDLSYKIVKAELDKEDPGSRLDDNGNKIDGYKTQLKDKLTSNNIVKYSKILVDDLNSNKNYPILSSNIKNFSSFLNISMDDGDDINNGWNYRNPGILSIRYDSNYDYFILKVMNSNSGLKITSIDFGIGSYAIDSTGNLAANAIHIDAINNNSYLPFIQYIGKDISGHPMWYIPNFNFSDTSVPQVDIFFSAGITMYVAGFYF